VYRLRQIVSVDDKAQFCLGVSAALDQKNADSRPAAAMARVINE
jgi:hypothetical protein